MPIYDINGNEIVANTDNIPDNNPYLDYLSPATQTNQYAGNTSMNAAGLYALYDAMLGTKADGYKVESELLGQDQSGTYNIYKYVFTPKKYTRTVLISTGMHGYEIVPIFTILTMMQDIVNNPSISEFHQYMHDYVRVILVPMQNPWGFSQTPRKYCNSMEVNENRNFGIKSEWEAFNAPAYSSVHPNTGKGEAPFDQAETQIMRDVVVEHMNEIDFWFDCHSSGGWDYDYYVQCNTDDTYMFNAISDAITKSVRPYLIANAGKTESNIKGLFNDPNTALKLHYAYKVLNVSCCTVEMTPQRFGGSEAGSTDLKFYLQQFSSYFISALNHFKDNARISNNHKYNNSVTLQSPNGSWFKLNVANDGSITTEEQ